MRTNEKPGMLVGIFSYPGEGKTSVLLQKLDLYAKENDCRVLLISYEMSKEQVENRINDLCLNTDLFVIIDSSETTIAEIENERNRVDNVGIIGIDYVQLMDECDRRGLSAFSKRIAVPVLYTSQLSRRDSNNIATVTDINKGRAPHNEADLFLVINGGRIDSQMGRNIENL